MDRQTILVIRLSAMGDVVLTVPLVREAARYRKVVVVTRPLFTNYFLGIDNVILVSADTSGRHSGLAGIFRLYKDIESTEKVDLVVDLHNVIRSRILSAIYRFSGRKIFRIDKGRKAKKRFIRSRTQDKLIHTTERYKRVFYNAGIKIGDLLIPSFTFSSEEISFANKYLSDRKYENRKWIAVAPFAMHPTKQWSVNNIRELLEDLDQTEQAHTFLFGGFNEKKRLIDITDGLGSVSVLAGEFSIRQELSLISMMDVMISMDSSNLHMAAISGIKTISLWGGTHPGIGFGPLGSQGHSIIQIPLEELPCRPCTIYGKGNCKLKEEKFKCLNYIKPYMVIDELRRMDVI